jgi:hypothetical protein
MTPSIDLSSVCAQLDWRNGTRFSQLAGSFLHSSGDIFDTKAEHDLMVLVNTNIVDPRASSGKGRASANANANVNALVRLDVIRSLSPAGLSTYDGFTSGLRLKELFIRRSASEDGDALP